MITLTLEEDVAAYLYDELVYAEVEPSRYIDRYQRRLSRMAGIVKAQLREQGVEGVMARDAQGR